MPVSIVEIIYQQDIGPMDTATTAHSIRSGGSDQSESLELAYSQGIVDGFQNIGLHSCVTDEDGIIILSSIMIEKLFPQVSAEVGKKLTFLDRALGEEVQDWLRRDMPTSGSSALRLLLGATKEAKPLILNVRRVRSGARGGTSRAAFYFKVVDEPKAPDIDVLKAMFELTKAESRLALALLNGHTIQTAARLLGISPETVRTQLRNLFRKTQTARQSDLLRAMLGVTGIFV